MWESRPAGGRKEDLEGMRGGRVRELAVRRELGWVGGMSKIEVVEEGGGKVAEGVEGCD